jgi:hypothetical protein
MRKKTPGLTTMVMETSDYYSHYIENDILNGDFIRIDD